MKFSWPAHVFRLFIRSALGWIQSRARRSQRASKTKGFTWNAAILVVVSARYSKGWIQGGAKIGRGRVSRLMKSSFRSNVHSNMLMYCRQYMSLFESCHSGCLFIWLNCLLLVIRWAIKGPWASSFVFQMSSFFLFIIWVFCTRQDPFTFRSLNKIQVEDRMWYFPGLTSCN